MYKNYYLMAILFVMGTSCVTANIKPVVNPSVIALQDIKSSVSPLPTLTPSVIVSSSAFPQVNNKVEPISIIIDTRLLLKDFRLNPDYPRKILLFKESYEKLDKTELDKIKEKYGSFEVFDPEIPTNILPDDGDICVDNLFSYLGVLINNESSPITHRGLADFFIRLNPNTNDALNKLLAKYKKYNIRNDGASIGGYWEISLDPKKVELTNLYKYLSDPYLTGISSNPIKNIIFSSINAAKIISVFSEISLDSTDLISHIEFLSGGHNFDKIYWSLDCDKRQQELNRNLNSTNSTSTPTPVSTIVPGERMTEIITDENWNWFKKLYG